MEDGAAFSMAWADRTPPQCTWQPVPKPRSAGPSGAWYGQAVLSADARLGREALVDLRRARRRRRTADMDVMEALYRAYVSALVGGAALWWLVSEIGGRQVAPSVLAKVSTDGPQVVGAVFALALAVGLRSGGRGGPLVVEAADVRHVLLAPVPRGRALRGPALRMLRFGGACGALAGAVIAVLAYRRLGGQWPAWAATGALVGGLVVAGPLGAAMVVSGARLGRAAAAAMALAVLAWAGTDLAMARATSPFSLLGEMALWPLRWRPAGLVGGAVALGLVLAGLALVGGTSVEASERRASLAGQLRFAATMRDMRTVVVLRRQLAQDRPRQRPWATLRPGAARGRRRPPGPAAASWRRGWHGVLRFPTVRLGRLAFLGAGAGAAAYGAWRGTLPLAVVAGLALYVAGLDVAEPMAQAVDHPALLDGYPKARGAVLAGLFFPSAVVMLAVVAVGAVTGAAMAGAGAGAAAVAAVTWVPASLAGLAGAVVSTVQGPPPLLAESNMLMPPEAVGARLAARTLWPPLVSTMGVLPVLAARGAGGAAAAAGAGIPVLVMVALVIAWARYHDPLHEAVKQAFSASGTGARGTAGGVGT
jgi:hypothetical protein